MIELNNMGKDYFSSVRDIYRIKGTISMRTPFRIGYGQRDAEYSTNQNPVMLRYDSEKDEYEPFIPGSSIKGVLRAAVHRIAKTHGYRLKKVRREEEPEIVGEIFGNMEHAAKVRVRDATYSGKRPIFPKEEPKMSTRGRRDPRQEEVLPPSDFDFEITVMNPSDEELSLFLYALEEINSKRAQFGGSVSRGRGFADIDYVVEKMEFGISPSDISWSVIEPDIVVPKKGPLPRTGDFPDFSVYMDADNKEVSGCIVLYVDLITEKPFKMKGIDEETVTMDGEPYIPGSVIKGFLRKKSGFRGQDEYRMFGGTKSARSRVLVSDFLMAKGEESSPDYIPEGTLLEGWIVLDNMTKNEIKQILSALNIGGTVTITGGASAKDGKRRGPRIYNEVSFKITDAVKYTIDEPEFEVEL